MAIVSIQIEVYTYLGTCPCIHGTCISSPAGSVETIDKYVRIYIYIQKVAKYMHVRLYICICIYTCTYIYRLQGGAGSKTVVKQ
jgi:hypothetical protein